MRKTTKIIAGLIAFILIAGIMFFANGLVGNPVSKFIANKSANQYIEDTYPELNLETEKAFYNFKTGGYSVPVRSQNSIDTYFSIDISPTGKISYDSYEDSALTNFNTWERIDTEYRKLTDEVFRSDSFPYVLTIDYGELKLKEMESDEPFGPLYGMSLEDLERDKIYNIKEIGKDSGHIVLYIADEKRDPERASEILLDIKNMFDEKDIPFYAIDFSLEEPRTEEDQAHNEKETFDVRDFLYTDIYEEGLVERLEEASAQLVHYNEVEDAKSN